MDIEFIFVSFNIKTCSYMKMLPYCSCDSENLLHIGYSVMFCVISIFSSMAHLSSLFIPCLLSPCGMFQSVLTNFRLNDIIITIIMQDTKLFIPQRKEMNVRHQAYLLGVV